MQTCTIHIHHERAVDGNMHTKYIIMAIVFWSVVLLLLSQSTMCVVVVRAQPNHIYKAMNCDCANVRMAYFHQFLSTQRLVGSATVANNTNHIDITRTHSHTETIEQNKAEKITKLPYGRSIYMSLSPRIE